ncbi:MAG: hypothetical protein ACLFWB_02365 [Armatimonadota bacterium]
MKRLAAGIPLCAIICLVVTAMYAVADENLCPNPGFEEGAKSGKRPLAWVNENGGGTWATDEVHSGSRSVKIVCKETRTRLWTSDIIPVEDPNRQFIVSVWAKLENVEGDRGAMMVLYHMDENGERIGQSGNLIIGGGATEPESKPWQQYFAASELTPEVKGVRVNLRLYRATGTAWFDDVKLQKAEYRPIEQAVPLRRGLDLAAPEGVTVVTADGADETAEAVRQTLEDRGVDAQIVKPAAINLHEASRDLILLGNLATSEACEHLYRNYYTFEDLYFPGAGGYVLRPLVNPLGTGNNMLVVGASDLAGLQRGAERLIEQIEAADDVLRCDVEVEIGEGYRGHTHFPWPAKPPWDEIADAANYLKSGDLKHARRYRQYVLDHWFDPDHRKWRHLFYITKTLSWELMHTCEVFSDEERLKITNELLKHLRGDQGFKYGGLRTDNGMIKENHATRAARAFYFGWRHFDKYYSDNIPAELQLWRRCLKEFWTLCLSSFRSREDSLSQHALGGSMDNTLDISFMEPEWSADFWSSERPHLMGRRCIIISNNMGQTVMLGDTNATDYATSLFSKFAYALDEGAYQFMIDKRDHMVTSTDEPMRGFNVGVQPRLPDDHIGLSICPGDPLYFKTEINYRMGVNAEEGFDKLAFRSGFDPDDEYLMLDGVSCGTHSYDDVNTIGEFSDNNRRWLIAIDRLKGPSMAFHNGVTVARDGLGAKKHGEAARLLNSAEGDGWAYTATSVPRYNGVDWNRHIIWLSGDYFFVLDEMQAIEPGEYSFVLGWRSLGSPELSGGLFSSRQDGPARDGAVVLDGRSIAAGASTEMDTPFAYSADWGGVFVHSDEIGDYFDVSVEVAEAGNYDLHLQTSDVGARGIVQVSVDGEDIGEPVDMYAEELTFSNHDLGTLSLDGGTHRVRFTVTGQNDSATGYMMGIRSITLAGHNGQESASDTSANRFWQHFPEDQPVTLDRDFELLGQDLPHNPYAESALNILEQTMTRTLQPTQSACFQNMFYAREGETTPQYEYRRLNEHCALVRDTAGVALVGAGVEGAKAEIDGLAVSGAMFYIGPAGVILHEADVTMDNKPLVSGEDCPDGVTALLQKAWDDAGTERGGADQSWSGTPELAASWTRDLQALPRSVVVRMTADGPRIDTGLESGAVMELDGSGEFLADFTTGGPVHAIDAADITGDGAQELLAGSDDETLYLLGDGLGEIWRRQLPFVRFDGIPMHWTLRSAKVRGLAADDINGDGKTEIIAGTGSMHVHCLNANGEELWRTPVPTGARWTYGIPDTITTADVFGEGVPRVLVGNGLKSYSAWCTVLDDSGEILQQYKNGGWAITCPAIAAGDLNRDGEMEVFCGNNLGDIRCFRGQQGKPQQTWWQNLSRVIRSMTIVPRGDHSIVAVGSDSGYLCAFDVDGEKVWGTPVSSAILHTALVQSPDGVLLAAGCKDGKIFVCTPEGELAGWFDAGGQLQGMSIGDVDGDGADEIITATASPDQITVIETK